MPAAENVEIVRRGYEAFNRGDVQTTLAMFDPRVEVHLSAEGRQVLGANFSDVYKGLDGFMEFLGQLQALWQTWSWEPEEFIEAGDGRGLGMVGMRGTAAGDVPDVEQPVAQGWSLQDGGIARHEA